MNSNKAWRKYLANHAEAETAWIDALPAFAHDHLLIIPAFDETSEFFDRLLPLLAQNSVLLIVVINQPDSLSTATPCNRKLYGQLVEHMLDANQYASLTLGRIKDSQSRLLVVDRFAKGPLIPSAQGVGLARKIGADLAIALMDRGNIKQPLLYCTDCDTTLPDDYFQKNIDCAALLYPFCHKNDDSPVASATTLYEFSIRYYQAGLCHAGSPYAFHTIGSCIAIDALAYCRAHGFPKRAGGEDFYLLNKLAKLGQVKSLTEPKILINPRLSGRVPFGTGPAVSRIMANVQNGKEFTVYHPGVFSELKQVLEAVIGTEDRPTAEMILEDLSPEAVKVLQELGLGKTVEKILCNLSNKFDIQLFIKHFNLWFDGFRTLKFIHGMRDIKYSNVPVTSLYRVAEQFNATWVKNVPGYRPASDSEI